MKRNSLCEIYAFSFFFPKDITLSFPRKFGKMKNDDEKSFLKAWFRFDFQIIDCVNIVQN